MASWISHSRVEEPPSTQTRPATSALSQIDNCCFLDWQCRSGDDWQSGFQAFRENSCKHPGVKIEGVDSFVALAESALDLLKSRAPNWYDYVVSGLNKIRGKSGSGTYGSVNVVSRTYTQTWEIAVDHDYEYDLVDLAGGMVHEACHVHRHEAGIPYSGREKKEETACVQLQREAVMLNDPGDRFGIAKWLHDLISNIDNPEYQWWH